MKRTPIIFLLSACALAATSFPDGTEMPVETGTSTEVPADAAARGLAFGRVKKVELEGLNLSRTVHMAKHIHYPFTRAQSLFWEFAKNQHDKLNTEIWDSLVNFDTIT